MRPLHASRFTCMLRRLKASTPGKKGLNRSLIRINSLIPCKGLTIITQLAAHSCRTLHAEGITDISDLFWRPENSKCMESTPTDDILRPQHHYYSCQSIVKKGLKCSLTPVPKAGPIESTKSRAYRRHQEQGLWKALRFCAFFCLDLASLATLCRGFILFNFQEPETFKAAPSPQTIKPRHLR